MKKRILMLACLAVVGGCVGTMLNRANLVKLQIGMSKGEVLEIMGKPDQIEADENIEIWYYDTGSENTFYGGYERTYTPLAFKNDKLASWGKRFVDEPEEIDKHEIRIR